MEKSFIIQVFLKDIYSRKGIHLKSGAFNSVSSATFTSYLYSSITSLWHW